MFVEHVLCVRHGVMCFPYTSLSEPVCDGIFFPVYFVSHWEWRVEVPPGGRGLVYMSSKALRILEKWVLFKVFIHLRNIN